MSWFKKKPAPSIAAAATAGAGTQVLTSGALREFVYLDEVSVYSLTSSPDAPPPVSMSEAASANSAEALKSALEVGAPGLAKSRMAAELNSARSNGLEVQRQFNIQSQFAQLHRVYSGSFALTAHGHAIRIERSDDLSKALACLQEQQRAAPVDMLTRGTLAELRVALRAHSMFDVAVFIKAAGGLIERHPELLPVPDRASIRQMMDLGELLNELMENLVPIEGLSSTYRLVVAPSGQQWVVDIDALAKTYSGTLTSSPLRVVGVAEQESFWKDTRRILHSDAEFDVLGRIRSTGLRPEWSPVKLTDAFDRVVPGVGDSLRQALDTLKHLAMVTTGGGDASTRLLLTGTKLLDALAAHHRVEPPKMSEAAIKLLLASKGSLEGELTALNQVAADFYSNYTAIERDPDAVASMRQAAWRTGKALADSTAQADDASPAQAPMALELEFVAMYW